MASQMSLPGVQRMRRTPGKLRVSRDGMKKVAPRKERKGKRRFEGGLCTSITARTLQEARYQVQQAMEARVDTVEFRLDYLEDFEPERDLEGLMEMSEVPYIVTYRPIWEGGRYDGAEENRLAVLKESAMMGAPFVDVELKAADAFFSSSGTIGEGTEIILSHHDYERTPELKDLIEIVQRMHDNGADIAKVATTVNDITDCKRLITLLQQQTRPAVVLGMGERGVMTRILAPKYGGFLTFGALSSGQESAPGQPTVESLRAMYHIQDIHPSTKVYGVIGNPIAHSKSPLFHNTCFRAAAVDAVFLPFLVDDFRRFMEDFTDPDFAGYSVTVPHKEAALEAAEEIDEVTAGIGASNTLVRTDTGSFKGYNTDWSAAIDIIENALGDDDGQERMLEGKTVVVVGAGGVAKALAYGASSRGAQVIVANRTIEKAEVLARRIPNCSVVALDDLRNGKVRGQVLANGTSLGMEPFEDTSAVPQEALKNFDLVFDAVYTPRETKLLKEAAQMGCKTASGVGMFVGQAQQQFELFTGNKPNAEVVKSLAL